MSPRVAVLGAGIMGCCLALELARRRVSVTLFDAAPAPMTGASRWNEGKIHLGHLYSADPSLGTARRVLPGGLAFRPVLEDLLGGPLAGVTEEDDIYLVHRGSCVAAEAMGAYLVAVTELARSDAAASGYLSDLRDARTTRLTPAEIERIADPRQVVAGFRVPERSVETRRIADRLEAAIRAEPRVVLRTDTRIERVRPGEDGPDGPWLVEGEAFDWVANALWYGRLAVDASCGLVPTPGWSHRYRVSVFLRTAHPHAQPSGVLAVGPFGDVKNYDGRDFYLSWYPSGLLAEGTDFAPPPLPRLDAEAQRRIASDVARHLSEVLPGVRDLFTDAREITVAGGYVFAQGQGSLDDPRATLHRRDRFGVARHGRYLSIDTGKYSTAPLLARTIADGIAGSG